MSGKKVDPSKLTLIFEEIMASDELNRLCADCHSKTPRWASTNLGVFLCIKCAGIHRSMGTHISKVKSVSLDGWEDYQIENMRRVGNSRAAKIYEHNLPADHRRPSENDGSRLEYWIRSKYERKLYYNKDLHNALQNGVEINADAGASSAPPMSNAAAGMAATGSRLPRRASNEDIRAVPQNRGAPAAELLSFDAPAPAPAKPQLVNDFFSAPAAAAAPAPVAAAPAPAPASSILSLYTQPIMPTAAPLVPQQGNMMAPAAAMQAPGQAPRQGPNYNVDLSHLRAGAPRPAAAPQYTPQQMMMLQQQQQQMMMMQQQQQQQMMMMQQQQQQQQRMGIPGYMSAMQQPGGYSMPATQQPGYGPLGYRPAPPRQ